MIAICAWKRQAVRSVSQPEHTRAAPLNSVELHHSVQWEMSLMLELHTD